MINLHNYHRVVESVAAEAYACTPEMSHNAHIDESWRRRLGFRALVGAARTFPEVWDKFYETTMLERGYKYVATGNEQLVVAQEYTALKIDRASLDMESDLRQSHAYKRQELYEVASLYFGQYILPQTVQVETAPLKYAAEAVVTRQPFVDIAVDDLHQAPEKLYELIDRQRLNGSYIAEQINVFSKTAKNVRWSEGFAPDIGGRGNLVVDADSNLVLLDSYLTTPEFRSRPSIKPGFETIEQEHTALTDKLWVTAKMLAELSGIPIY